MACIKGLLVPTVASLTLVLASESRATLTVYDHTNGGEAAWQAAAGPVTVADFELPGRSVPVTDQYPGATFAPSHVGSPMAVDTPIGTTVSGAAIMETRSYPTGDGGCRIDFDEPVNAFGLWFAASEMPNSYVWFHDSQGQTFDGYPFQNAVPQEGWTAAQDWVFVGFVSDANDIYSVDLAHHNQVWLGFDNVQWVPEPTTLSLLALGGLPLLRRRR